MHEPLSARAHFGPKAVEPLIVRVRTIPMPHVEIYDGAVLEPTAYEETHESRRRGSFGWHRYAILVVGSFSGAVVASATARRGDDRRPKDEVGLLCTKTRAKGSSPVRAHRRSNGRRGRKLGYV